MFPAGKKDKAAGLLVVEGVIRKGLHARLTREDVIVSATTIQSLRGDKIQISGMREIDSSAVGFWSATADVLHHLVLPGIVLGTVPLASFNPMHLLLPLREKYPELHFQLSSLSSEQVIDGLSRNQLDLGICYLDQVNTSFFEVIELGTTTMGLLHDTRHFQFASDRLRWEELGDIPLGLLSKGMHYRQSLDLSFRSRSLEPNAVLESDSSFQLIQATQGRSRQ